MVLPALYDALLQHSRVDFEEHASRGLPNKTPKKLQAIRRCVTPWNDDSTETKRSDDGRLIFPDSDVESTSYAYSVGPFAHTKSEGTLSLSAPESWALKDFTAAAANKSLLGTGKFGSVQLHHTRSLGKVALKVLDKSTLQDQSMWKREVEIQTRYVHLPSSVFRNASSAQAHTHKHLLFTSISIVCRLSHTCILPCFGYFQSHTSLYIVLDYCSWGDLTNFINKYDLSLRDCKQVVAQLTSALVYLQELNVAHRDVKTENVLVSAKEPLQCKLADFGYAVHCPDSDFRNTLCGTLACLPPEMLASHTRHYHAMTTDAWSLGILAHELVLGEPVFAWPGSTKAMKELISAYLDSNLRVRGSADFSHFVSSLLRRHPASRMTPRQTLRHPWLSEKQLRDAGDSKYTKRRRLDF